MTIKKRAAFIGEGMVELRGSPFGEMSQYYGGDTVNTASYLARLGKAFTEVNFVTAVGTDDLSNGMVERMQADGIRTSFVMRDEKRQPGLYMIKLDEKGERSFQYWRVDSAARAMFRHKQFSQISEQLQYSDLIYLTAISVAILMDNDRRHLRALLGKARQNNAQVVFDSNYRPSLWQIFLRQGGGI
ncbi:PfkB family carbohydrate kinase [Veronia nyctiphanis]|nr:PfkB family carbohydrate kinase [Veronia nyctiphanis]